METEQVLSFSVSSMIEDVLQQHDTRLSDRGWASRKAEESSLRRYEAAGWLRKTVGVVGGKDLPAEPSEEEFRIGLRSGIILCNVLNKVQPGAVPKVVEGPCDSVIIPDGAALSAYQYFENVRNFLVAVEELGLPTFEASDFEQGGKSARIVNCVLALKSYSEWKQEGGHGSWKLGGNFKQLTSGKPFVRKSSEPFMNSFSRVFSPSEKSSENSCSDPSLCGDLSLDLNEAGSSRCLNMIVREVLSNKNQEEIPIIVESMLFKVMEEFEQRLASQNELKKTTANEIVISGPDNSPLETASGEKKVEEEPTSQDREEEWCDEKCDLDKGSKSQFLNQHKFVEQQQRDILELKHILRSTKAGMKSLQMKYHEEFNQLGKHLRSLANAASRYHKVTEENRKLYNQVQDLKGNIRVYCRVRPFLPGQPNNLSTVDRIEEGNITIITPSKYSKEGRKSFTFNKVFGPSASQEEVFLDTQPLIRSVLDGYNVCIFAYGQTGSGKTYTMSGPIELTEEGLGVNHRALGDLFLLSEQKKDLISYDISVQMLEIYNEQVRDLLTDGANKRLEIRNSSQNGINVPEANLVPVSSTSDVINLMNIGQKNRAVSATAMNDRSSRSHSCLTVHVQGRDLTSGSILRGCMHLVDLAGSERVDKSEVTGDRLKEAQHINKSLSALGDVISALAQKNSHVPYRNSKLTQLLQDSLGGQAKTLMFVHISPELDALGETISTLKFAERVSTVELGAARVNKDGSYVKDLKEQITSLKAALARKEVETEGLQQAWSSPERIKIKSCGSSPSHPSWRSVGHLPGPRQPVEDVGNLEPENRSALLSKRRSLDLQDMLKNSPPWLPIENPGPNGKEEDKDSVSGDWVDKVMVNKHDSVSRDENPMGQWEVDGRQLPGMFGQSNVPEQAFTKLTVSKKESQDYMVSNGRCEMATDDSDELEAATSDSSEPDMLWQLNLPKSTNIPSSMGSKTKKTSLKSGKGQESRCLIPSPHPSPSRIKPPNGIGQSLHKPGRQAVPADGKRRSVNAK